MKACTKALRRARERVRQDIKRRQRERRLWRYVFGFSSVLVILVYGEAYAIVQVGFRPIGFFVLAATVIVAGCAGVLGTSWLLDRSPWRVNRSPPNK